MVAKLDRQRWAIVLCTVARCFAFGISLNLVLLCCETPSTTCILTAAVLNHDLSPNLLIDQNTQRWR